MIDYIGKSGWVSVTRPLNYRGEGNYKLSMKLNHSERYEVCC
jgi:hypothetical protein